MVALGAGLVIILAGLHAAATIVNLTLLSALVAATISPLPFFLSRRGVNRAAAVVLTAAVVLVGGIVLIVVLGKSLGSLSQNLPQYQSSLADIVERLSGRLAARGLDPEQALKPDVARVMGAVRGLVGAALGLLGYGLFAVVLVVLMLLEMPVVGPGHAAPGSLQHRLDEAMRLVRRFVGLNGLLGGGVAIGNFFVMLLLGTDSPAVWAVLSFLFAFVPFGFVFSVIPPVVLTLLEQGAGQAGLLFALLFALNFIGDNVLKPKVMGGGLGLSPLVIVLSLLLWGFVLGPVGALLAVPLTLTLRQVLPVLVEHEPAL
ncbi:MAG TPA: AI-2E family transporter [Gemmatimonadales bacterium]|nr:AI-2E family transporter [Gemmatimonadales bacterium]